jgi:hypothetical protein
LWILQENLADGSIEVEEATLTPQTRAIELQSRTDSKNREEVLAGPKRQK